MGTLTRAGLSARAIASGVIESAPLVLASAGAAVAIVSARQLVRAAVAHLTPDPAAEVTPTFLAQISIVESSFIAADAALGGCGKRPVGNPEPRSVPAKSGTRKFYDPIIDDDVEREYQLPERNFLTFSLATGDSAQQALRPFAF